jgi:uncharacterized protein YqeY
MSTVPQNPEALRSALRADLVTAMKARQSDAVAALRTTLAAFDNAEAVAAPASPGTVVTSEHFAGSAAGLGATEAVRRVLSLDDMYGILRAQVAERNSEAENYESLGQSAAAARLRREVDVLRGYLPG